MLASSSPRSVLIFLLAVVELAFVARSANASCNLRPVARRQYASVLGGVGSPITAPSKTVDLTLTGCDFSDGFEPVAADNDVTVRFEPPGPGVDTDVAIDSSTVTVSDCVLPDKRCRVLSFPMPDTTAALPPNGLAGPARVLVRDSSNVLVAELGELFAPTFGCDKEPETVFEQFTVLPPANNFADAEDGSLTELRATVDGGGNLLVPFDYWGAGTRSVLAEAPGAPTAMLVEGTAAIPAADANDPNTIADALAAQVNPSSFVRSFTLNGRPLPPLLRATATGSLFGSIDAVESVLRIARNDGMGGLDLYDLSDRLSAAGRGPIIVDSFTVEANDPVPLKSLRSSAATVAFARNEIGEDTILNGDGDKTDLVVSVVNAGNGVTMNLGEAVAETSLDLEIDDPYIMMPNGFVFPAIATDGNIAAFLGSEEGQGDADVNLDGDASDAILRVYDRDGTELSAGLDLDVSTSPIFDGRPIAVSGDRVFFRGPSNAVERTFDSAINQPGPPVLSPDEAFLYVTGAANSSIYVYSRDPVTGQLTLVQPNFNGFGGIVGMDFPVAAAISPDGDHLYALGLLDNSIVVFDRDEITGALTFVENHEDGLGGVDGLDMPTSLAISPDGMSVYVTGSGENKIAVFDRDPLTGALTFLEFQVGPLGLTSETFSVVVSPDGANVYAYTRNPLLNDVPAYILTFSRDGGTGALTPMPLEFATASLPHQLAMSPDGGQVYGGASSVLSWAVRDALTGELSGSPGPLFSLDSGMAATDSVSVSPNGARVYRWFSDGVYPFDDRAGITVFTRNTESGDLTVADVLTEQVPGGIALNRVRSVTETQDGRHLYVTGEFDESVTLFRRDLTLRAFDAETQSLRPTQALASRAVAAGERVLFTTSEQLDGGDLNSDTDDDDEVASILDVSGPADSLIPLSIAANQLAMSDTLAAMTVPEAQDPSVSNGDGDRDDEILAVYSLVGPPLLYRTNLVADNIQVSGNRVVVTTPEYQSDETDLNGNGVATSTERVIRVYDYSGGAPGVVTELGYAIVDFVVSGSLVAFRVLESFQGEDLDGDGFFNSRVMLVYDLDTEELVNTRSDALRCDFLPGCEPRSPYRIDAQRRTVSFLASEGFGIDLDGDGDFNDIVLIVYHLPSRKAQVVSKVRDDVVQDPAMADLPALDQALIGEPIAYVPVIESDVNLDLNSDGVINDTVTVAVVADVDRDGAFDDFDTCVETVDVDQADRDVDGLGDVECDPKPPLCPPVPLPGCLGSTDPGSSKLSMDDKEGGEKDSLKFSLKKAVATVLDDLGDPVNALPLYTLCVYDSSAEEQPLMNSVILAHRLCGKKPCWKDVGGVGFKMTDKSGFPSGVQKVGLKSGGAGEGSVSVKSKGLTLILPTLPLTLPLTVQLIADDGVSPACWSATFSEASKNEIGKLKARSD